MVMRLLTVLMLAAAAAGAVPAIGGAAPAKWSANGQAAFLATDYKAASRAFERAAAENPEDPEAYFWLAKSYARMAEMASPLTAGRDVRKAQENLERAVAMAPGEEHIGELFELYVNFRQQLGPRALDRAAELAHLPEARLGAEQRLSELERARRDDAGAGARLRRGWSAALRWLDPDRHSRR